MISCVVGDGLQVHSGGRKRSVAPLSSPLAWAPAPVPVPASTDLSNRRRYSITANALPTRWMGPCDRRADLITALSNAKQRALRQLEEDVVFGLVLELKLCLYELAMAEAMESYMEHELHLLEERLAAKRDAKLLELRRRQAKEKAAGLADPSSAEHSEALQTRHAQQTERMMAKWGEMARSRRARFHEGRLRSGDVLQSKLSSLRRWQQGSPLSEVGLEKLKSVCLVYQTLRANTD